VFTPRSPIRASVNCRGAIVQRILRDLHGAFQFSVGDRELARLARDRPLIAVLVVPGECSGAEIRQALKPVAGADGRHHRRQKGRHDLRYALPLTIVPV